MRKRKNHMRSLAALLALVMALSLAPAASAAMSRCPKCERMTLESSVLHEATCHDTGVIEDVTTYTTLGSRGELFFTFVDVHIIQVATQSLGGGMTEAYKESGTYLKTFYSVMSMPSAIKVGMMYSKHQRIHHRIDWESCVPKILNEKYRKERQT